MTAKRTRAFASISDTGGFTLLEVMVSLVILAIGVMGVIAMQMNTYQQLQTSHNYAKAAMLAGDLADRMLANCRDARENLSYVHDKDDAPGSITNCATADCSLAELAEFDIFTWQRQVTGGTPKEPGSLPAGAGAVVQDAVDAASFNITVRWDDDLSGSEGEDCVLTDEDDLDCYTLVVTMPPATVPANTLGACP